MTLHNSKCLWDVSLARSERCFSKQDHSLTTPAVEDADSDIDAPQKGSAVEQDVGAKDQANGELLDDVEMSLGKRERKAAELVDEDEVEDDDDDEDEDDEAEDEYATIASETCFGTNRTLQIQS